MVRYPHTAFLIVKSHEDENQKPVIDNNGDAVILTEVLKTEIKCRYEPNNQNNSLDYSAKIFTPIIDGARFSKDGHFLEFEGMRFTIVQLHNFQKHCEIWVE